MKRVMIPWVILSAVLLVTLLGCPPPGMVTLTVSVTGNGTVTPASGSTYSAGTVVGLTATPDAGWTFSGWSGDLSGSTNPASLVMDADKTVTATFVSGTSGGAIEITDDITDVTTWTTGNIYLIRAWDFYVENTLTIEPGVIVKFHPSDGPYMNVSGSGTIVADGTASEPIIFTSYKDDTHGGDTNGDGTATSPARGDWGQLDLQDVNGNTFDYCEFYYGGDNSYGHTLAIWGSNNSVTNCTFAHNAGDPPGGSSAYGALDFNYGEAGTVITGNTFYDNVVPLSIGIEASLDDSNVFHNPSDTSVTNDYQGIFVETIEDLDSPISWGETEVAYVIDDVQFIVRSGATLTLADDVVLKFTNDSQLRLDEGPTSLPNYNGTGVAFTSYKDDTRKGDTNGDGSATTPGANDWLGVYDNRSSGHIPSPYYFGWANIYYDSY